MSGSHRHVVIEMTDRSHPVRFWWTELATTAVPSDPPD